MSETIQSVFDLLNGCDNKIIKKRSVFVCAGGRERPLYKEVLRNEKPKKSIRENKNNIYCEVSSKTNTKLIIFGFA